jgi:hypothetical protein
MLNHPIRRAAVAMGLAVLAGAAWAQVTVPEGATTPDAADVKKWFDDRTYKVRFADGTDLRLEYKANGYYWVNTSRGFNSSGTWEAKDGQVCTQLKGRDRSCNDVRMHAGSLYLKRDTGEIVRFDPN